MTRLINSGPSDPTEWYREFEEVHPFVDGNGRVGSILWNWLRGELRWPFLGLAAPPDLWSEQNRAAAQEHARRRLIAAFVEEST